MRKLQLYHYQGVHSTRDQPQIVTYGLMRSWRRVVEMKCKQISQLLLITVLATIVIGDDI